MAFCTSCGSEVAASASFCTSCGRPVAANPQTACASCGAQVEASSAFCTSCGQSMSVRTPARPVEAAPPESPVVTMAAAAAVAPAPAAAPAPATPTGTAFCTSCGNRLDPGIRFCTGCGQSVPESSQPAPEKTIIATPVLPTSETPHPFSAAPAPVVASAPVPTPAPVAAPAPAAASAESPYAAASLAASAQPSEPAPQYAAPPYPPAQPRSNMFRNVVIVLLLVVVIGGCGGWYFWGVETIIVSAPPDVTVYLDDKELAPTSYGRYVVPHLSRKTHFLKVQCPGFADTIQRLDFPLTSFREWVNIKLVPSHQIYPR